MVFEEFWQLWGYAFGAPLEHFAVINLIRECRVGGAGSFGGFEAIRKPEKLERR